MMTVSPTAPPMRNNSVVCDCVTGQLIPVSHS